MKQDSKTAEPEAMNTWQLCPMCSGTKMQPYYHDDKFGNITLPVPCQICNATGLLSQQTGLPPTK